LTISFAVACAAVTVLSPEWRSALQAQTYYRNNPRMTGGGSIGDGKVKHGFELYCDLGQGPNNLEINWGKGTNFHLDTLTSASCTGDPTNSPRAGFNTYDGTGTGRLNGKPATAEWTFIDGGEPGTNDFADIVVTDSQGNTFSVSGFLSQGNHQAHGQ
jgi:hypothetical protein